MAYYRIYRIDRHATTLPIFMLFVTLSMYILYSAYWALDVYLLWIEIYRYLPREGAEPAVMFLDGLLIPWSVAYYTQTAIQFVMVNLYACTTSEETQAQWFPQLVLGDTVSLWRAYVVWSRPRWLFTLFIFMAVVESGAFLLKGVRYEAI